MKSSTAIFHLFKGLFSGSPIDILIKFTWEIFQTISGIILGLIFILSHPKVHVSRFHGAILISCFHDHIPFWGGVSPGGRIIIGGKNLVGSYSNALFMHEYGHILQSRSSGPLYIFKYAIPSLFSAARRYSGWIHAHHKAEQDANRRAYDYFKDETGFKWDYRFNPILEMGQQLA